METNKDKSTPNEVADFNLNELPVIDLDTTLVNDNGGLSVDTDPPKKGELKKGKIAKPVPLGDPISTTSVDNKPIPLSGEKGILDDIGTFTQGEVVTGQPKIIEGFNS